MKIRVVVKWASGPVETYECEWVEFRKTDNAVYINSERIQMEDVLEMVIIFL